MRDSAPSLEEATLDFLDLAEGFLWWHESKELMDKDGAKDGFNQSEAACFVHQPGVP